VKAVVKFFLQLLLVTAFTEAEFAATLTNGGFESGLVGWRPLWTREAKAGWLAVDRETAHSGKSSARIKHRGEKDWSLEPACRVSVQPGDVYELEAWVKLATVGDGSATLCVATYDGQGRPMDWSYGARSVREASDWRRVQSRLVLPEGVADIQPRLIGYGPATVWADDFSLEKKASLNFTRRRNLPATLVISNGVLAVALNTSNATVTVLDRRTNERSEQQLLRRDIVLLDATATRDEVKLTVLYTGSGLEIAGKIHLEADAPEFTFELSAQGELPAACQFPHPFATKAGDYLVVPMNEGISYPVEDKSIEAFRLIAYGGHGICMGFWGATDGVHGHGVIIETPEDAAIRIDRVNGRLTVAPEWDAQRGQFGYARRLRYVFFDQGGHVAIAKRYRAYAQKVGLLKTLAQKRSENPNVDLLTGAVNIWCWDRDAVSIVREMQSAGIERILWSNRQTPENLRALNDLHVLTSRYDIYQDVMNPDNFQFLRGTHPDWTTAAWPNDIILDVHGNWLRGWGVKGKDDKMYPCGVICDRRALDYARARIPPELATHPYRARFIDTTTAAPWHECYHTNHPMTRTESKQCKMELLRYVSEDTKLVTGCETGHDASVPFLHYFEGMLSLGPYRVPDSGRDMARIWTNAPERVVKFQLGHEYRLPLWELVYHDCVVAQWYWGDYNNKLPMLWDKRDLFNLLYATPPMFMFNRELWQKNRARFVQSYRNTCPTVRELGYSEMTDHRFLAPDRSVQQTAFANGTKVTVNFGNAPYRLSADVTVSPMGYHVEKAK
jgi:glycosyl hydrolase family 129/carbohydrate binding protein with CBM4/9 domain